MFEDPAAFEYLSSVGSSRTFFDLHKEPLFMKFDQLTGRMSRTTDGSMPLPPSFEERS